MKTIKNILASVSLASLLSGCIATIDYVREEEIDDSQISLEVYVPGRSSIIILPCNRAGVRFEQNEYQIKCNVETFFIHNNHSDYLQFGNVSYFDENQDGTVDRVSFNDSSLLVNNYSIDRFYQEKLHQFRKNEVDRLWADYLRTHPNLRE